jgi:ribosomal protein S18 acetylase RimI-like enzyme
MSFTIRPVEPADFAALGEVTVQVYKDLLPPVPEAAAYLEQMRDVRSRAEDTELLVAVDDATGAVLGGVSFVRPGGSYAQSATSDEGEFRLLAVASAAQRQGVGEALVRACLDRARQLGLSGMALTTQQNMQAAHRLYRRLGFERAPQRDFEPVPGVVLWVFTTEFDKAG